MSASPTLLNPPDRWLPRRVISDGQTGVNRAALDWALAHGLEIGGWCSHGRKCEDGTVPAQYPPEELAGTEHRPRTRRNVGESDASLILSLGKMSSATMFTLGFAAQSHKPHLMLTLSAEREEANAAEIVAWLAQHQPQVLHVSGPREGKAHGAGAMTRRVLDLCLSMAPAAAPLTLVPAAATGAPARQNAGFSGPGTG